jgi:uncharacterized protein YdaT
MPWTDKDAHSKTHRAKTPKRKRQWRKVANAILERTVDEGRAVRGANAAVKKAGKRKKTRKASR